MFLEDRGIEVSKLSGEDIPSMWTGTIQMVEDLDGTESQRKHEFFSPNLGFPPSLAQGQQELQVS